MFEEKIGRHLFEKKKVTSNKCALCVSSLSFPCFPSGPSPEAEEYVVEGKTDALLLRPCDGFPQCSWMLMLAACMPSLWGGALSVWTAVISDFKGA